MTVSISAENKVYDGSTTATLNVGSASLSGVVSGDSVSLDSSSYTANFADDNVSTGITVTESGLGLSGAQASDYTLTQPTGLSANITPKALTISSGVTAADKVYDGGTAASLDFDSPTLSGVVGSDDVSVDTSSSYTATFDDANVNNDINVTVTGLGLNGSKAGDYTLTQPDLNADITPFELTLTVAVSSKTYDGNTCATFASTPTLSGVIGSDDVSLAPGYYASFSSANVGDSGAITLYGFSLTGGQADDYTFTLPSVTAGISPHCLTITASNQTITYGDTTSLGSSAFTDSGLQADDTIDSVMLETNATTSGSDNWNVGSTWTITPSAATGSSFSASNYSITYVTGTLTVTQKCLTVTGLSGTNKFYDGTTSDPITGTACLHTVISDDTVTLTSGSAAFASASVGTGKTVTFSGFSIGGADAGNYSFSQPANSTANIGGSLTVAIVGTNNTPTQIGNGAVNLKNGDLTLTGLGASSCGCITGVTYNSSVADPQPIITFSVTLDGSLDADEIQATLTWNGTPQSPKTFTGLSGGAGATYTFSLQVATAVSATGNYDFSVSVTAESSSPSTSETGSASAPTSWWQPTAAAPARLMVTAILSPTKALSASAGPRSS